MAANLQLISVPHMPLVAPGDNLAAMILRCLASTLLRPPGEDLFR